MIDKLTPRFLDKSSDEKLVQKTSFVDALNIYVDGEFAEDSAGVIKSINGTTEITLPYYAAKDWFCIGHVVDENTGIVYFFMVATSKENHGIWAYDHRGVLPTRTLVEGSNYTFTTTYSAPVAKSLHRIVTSDHFNFPTNGYVAADIVYSNSNEFSKHNLAGNYPEKDVLLYFTDNKNEPRMVNVYRAYMNNGLPSDDRQEINDFICACPRVPMYPITFAFENDDSVVVNNFAATPGFQFAYQNIYKDGLESAISPYSDIAFPPSIINRGATQKDNILAHNKCVLTIPSQNSEVESVRVLARYGNGANFVEIDEVDNPADGNPIVFPFLNDRVAGGVPKATTDKTFDNLPRRAESQTVVSNRLVYGNYVEGFDNVDCSGVVLEPIYAERPLELLDYSFKIEPSIELTGDGNDTPGDVQNKTIGFKIDADQFADTVDSNTLINVSFSFSPDKNFHVYSTSNIGLNNAEGGLHESYHQSRQVGEKSLNLPGYRTDSVAIGSAAASQENAYQSQAKAGAKYLQADQENYFGKNRGVGKIGPASCGWKLRQQGPLSIGNVNVSRNAIFGTSAANPLILKGGQLTFSVEFVVNQKISSGAKTLILGIVAGLLRGDVIDDIAAEVGFDPGLITVKNVKNSHVHNINLGLSDYDQIPVSSDVGSMICGGHVLTITDDVTGKPPSFAFVVNKAEVPFYLEGVPDKPQRFRICIENVYVDDADSVVTCVKDLDPYSPWFAITPTTLGGSDFTANFLAIWAQHLSPSPRVFRQVSGATAVGAVRNFSDRFVTTYTTPNGYPVGGEQSGVIMENCFGVFEPIVGADSRKRMLSADGGSSPFSFTMLDGEGGPGGKGSPGDAYDILGCEKYGSIAGQVFLEYDQSSIAKCTERGYEAYAFSGDPVGVTSGEHVALKYVSNVALAGELGLSQHETYPNFGYLHRSVLQGPLYTGRIVINNITSNEPFKAYVNPEGTSMPQSDFLPTTTLPMIWFSSWTKFGDLGASLQDVLIKDPNTNFDNSFNSIYSGYQVSFPYPIVVGTLDGGSGGFVDGELVSGEIVEDPFGIGVNSVNFERLHSHCELGSSTTNVESGSFSGGNSFKAGATHEFGIVYYDERGRHGYVNPIGSVFVKTLGERDSDSERGAAFVKASNIVHDPPSWAKYYRFAYSKNTSINKFIQYNSGGAFVANSDYEGGSPTEFYVSLNYLQGHPISYSNSFGARGSDGTPVLYSFTPGDRLRVLSYMLSQTGNNISRVYPNNVEFEVTGVTQFTDDNNPFSYTDPETNEVVVKESMKGLFLVIKNNIDAIGFRYQDIEQGADNWDDNCIFEIYSPAKEVDADNRLYYEIGSTYPVVYAGYDTDGDGEPNGYKYFHKNEDVLLTQGDVFFRRHAVNLREFNGGFGFTDLLDPIENEEQEVAAEANFKNYYLESEAATDLFPSRAISVGRPNIIKLDARESKKQASLIHSDRDVVEASKVGYSSFNRTVSSDMEIDFKAGPVHYMCNHQDSIFFIQNNKCGHIPVDRTLISDASGSQSLIASSKFLGTPRYYAGDAGCDGNPESVVNVDTTAYFVNKSKAKVYKVHPSNGVNVISDLSMAAFFREELGNAVTGGKRIVGGYDPIKKEYLLTTTAASDISYAPPAETLDETLFEAVVIDTTSAGVDFPEGGGFVPEGTGDEDQTGAPAVVRFDWSVPSNLQPPTWQLVYEDGDVEAPESPNIIFNNCFWKSSPNGGSIGLGTDLALRCTVENPHNLPASAATYLITIDGASSATDHSVWQFDLGDLDNQDVSLLRQLTIPYAEGQVGNNFHFSRSLVDEGPFTVTYYNGLPSVMQLKVNPYGVEDGLTVYYSDGDVVTFDIPIRFVCREDLAPFEIMQAFVIGNMEQCSASVYDSITIATQNQPFKIGSSPNNNVSVNRALYGEVFWQASQAFTDLEVAVDTGVGTEPILFNPAHPTYGLCPYVVEGGIITSESVNQWIADSGLLNFGLDEFGNFVINTTPGGPFELWLQISGISTDDPDYDSQNVTASIFDVLTPLIGQPITCYIVGLG